MNFFSRYRIIFSRIFDIASGSEIGRGFSGTEWFLPDFGIIIIAAVFQYLGKYMFLKQDV